MSAEGEISPSDQLPAPVAGEDMHIHKPKAAHSAREFLSEISVIVIGIVIALSGEQLLDWFHWQHEVAETRTILSKELAHDLGILEFRSKQSDCIAQRVSDLERYRDGWRNGRPLKLIGPIVQPFLYRYNNDAWLSSQNQQSIAHMPIKMRMDYEYIYNKFRFLEEQRSVEGLNWEELTQFEGAKRPDEHDLMHLTLMLNKARLQNLFYEFNGPTVKTMIDKLGVQPDDLKGSPEVVRQLCIPLIA